MVSSSFASRFLESDANRRRTLLSSYQHKTQETSLLLSSLLGRLKFQIPEIFIHLPLEGMGAQASQGLTFLKNTINFFPIPAWEGRDIFI